MLKTREELQEAIHSTGTIGYNDDNIRDLHKIKILYHDMECWCGAIAIVYMYEGAYYYTCPDVH